MHKKINKKVSTIAVALIAGIIIGLGVVPTLANDKLNRGQNKAPQYSTNTKGQTYGSVAKAISIETEPDLIAAIGVDGTKGYVLKEDLQDKTPKTPEEAVAITKEIQEKALEAKSKGSNIIREIPLYDVNGETVIGKFGITAPNFDN